MQRTATPHRLSYTEPHDNVDDLTRLALQDTLNNNNHITSMANPGLGRPP